MTKGAKSVLKGVGGLGCVAAGSYTTYLVLMLSGPHKPPLSHLLLPIGLAVFGVAMVGQALAEVVRNDQR